MSRTVVSIVVPVYNVQAYIERCILSLLSQTYKNLEILLVDDGSTDNSGKICDVYAKQDARITVIHKTNGGLSDARNVAIDVAKGDYILCVDSDDYLHPEAVNKLLEIAQEDDSDIAVTSFVPVYGEGVAEDSFRSVADGKICFTSREALKDMLYQKHMTTSAWGKLYKTELFGKDIRYPKGKLCEDLDTTYKLFARAERISFHTTPMYYYLQRSGSIINSQFKPGRFDALQFAKDELSFVEEHFPGLNRAAQNRLFMEAIYILLTMNKDARKEYNEYYKACRSVLRRYRVVVLLDPSTRPQHRVYALLACLSTPLIYTPGYIKNVIRKGNK